MVKKVGFVPLVFLPFLSHSSGTDVGMANPGSGTGGRPRVWGQVFSSVRPLVFQTFPFLGVVEVSWPTRRTGGLPGSENDIFFF